jgi:hypothetical protein
VDIGVFGCEGGIGGGGGGTFLLLFSSMREFARGTVL